MSVNLYKSTQAGPDGISVIVSIEAKPAEDLAEKLAASLTTINRMNKAVRRGLNLLQKEAVLNASGRTVSFAGNTFTINRQTGNLTKQISVSYESALAGTVRSSADYAAAVEEGHKPIDLKKTRLVGRIVPIPVSKNTPGAKKSTLVASTGKANGSTYVIFRYVSPKSKGWIIPAAKPRPYMGAAAHTVAPIFEKDVAQTFLEAFGPIQP